MRVLLVHLASSTPRNLDLCLARPDCAVMRVDSVEAACNPDLLNAADAVLIWPGPIPALPSDNKALVRLMDALEARCVGTLVLEPDGAPSHNGGRSLVTSVHCETSAEELWGRLATMKAYRSALRTLERELDNMQRLGKKLNQHFVEMDHEMQLASRLQRDFLPGRLPEIPPARFSVLYRPAHWVSGDSYDVFRVDEDHVGFYVVDAVGHGVAAGLLTMFVKKALPAKLVETDSYVLLDPSQSMRMLNRALLEQNLPGNQYVTACYCLLNTRTLELQIARGGHPYPVHVSTTGQLTGLKAEGGLLGLFEEEDFPLKTTYLQPGEKVLVFSDGVELAFVREPDDDVHPYRYQEEFQSLAMLPADQLIAEFSRRLDGEEGSLNPRDDITMVALEILPD